MCQCIFTLPAFHLIIALFWYFSVVLTFSFKFVSTFTNFVKIEQYLLAHIEEYLKGKVAILILKLQKNTKKQSDAFQVFSILYNFLQISIFCLIHFLINF